MRYTLILLFTFCLVFIEQNFLEAKLIKKDILYRVENKSFKGYVVYDDSFTSKRPGVLVVHEWWGHNDYARKRTEMLAKLGYVAMALDMYGNGKKASHPKDAKKFMTEVMKNMDQAVPRFTEALKVLKEHPYADKDKIAAIGYCFGGGIVLNMARRGFPLKGVVSFHGSLATKTRAKKGDVKAAILVCHGAKDSFVSKQELLSFEKEMKEAEVDLTFKMYKNAKHSFTNPKANTFAKKFNMPGLKYDPRADRKSWADMKSFFRRIFE
ncbi:hypothetical protein AB834_03120 [PVC group bacterium (ex Bugula neritina AB1)]|nr:hypothetical protein AB834_03120 [PVC group bacterium (ex Bugula neritina AB1)]